MNDEPLFSRSSNSTTFGKCDDRLDIPIPGDTREAIVALAFASGMTAAEYVRNLLFAHVYGHAELLRKRNVG